jgi:hypothetical protein
MSALCAGNKAGIEIFIRKATIKKFVLFCKGKETSVVFERRKRRIHK